MNNPFLRFLNLLLKIVFFIPGTIYHGTKAGGEWLERRIRRDGWERSLIVYILGLPIAGITGWHVADVLSFAMDFGTAAWTVILIVASVIIWAIVWPGLYYLLLRHVWNMLEKAFKYWNRLCRDVLSPMLAEIVVGLRKAPGSDKLWSNVISADGVRGPAFKVLEVVLTLAALGLLGFGAYVLYGVTETFGSVYVTSPALMMVVSLAVAATAFGSILSLLVALVDSKVPNVIASWSTLVAGAVAWSLHHFLAVDAVANGLAALAVWIFSMTYGLPGVITLMQTGTLKKVVMKWYKLLDTCYHEEENTDFQRFWQHLLNLVLAPVAGYVLFSLSMLAALPLWAGLSLAAIAAVYSYSESGRKYFGQWKGNMDAGITFDVLVTYLVYAYVSPQTGVAGVGLAIVTFLVLFIAVYPALYLFARGVSAGFAGPVGVSLEALHGRLSAGIHAFFDKLSELRDKAFGDRSDFARLFGHLLNLTLVVVALVSGSSALLANLTGMVWLNYVIVAFIAVNVLVLFGRLFSRYSAETLAFVLGLAVAGPVAYFAYGASESFAVAAGLAIVLGSLVGGVFAPLFYIAARNLFTGITPVLAPVFDKIFDGLWQLYVGIWTWLGTAVAAVMTWLAPVFMIVRAVWGSIAQSLSKIFG